MTSRKPIIYGGSIALLALLILMIADNVRPWRRLQAEFLELERQSLLSRLQAERNRDPGGAEALQAALASERGRLAEQQADIERLQKELRDFAGKLRRAERRQQAALRGLDSARLRRDRTGIPQHEEVRNLEEEAFEARIEIEGLREFVENRQQRLAELRSGVVGAEKAWADFDAPAVALEARLAELEAGSWLRKLPVLELFQPAIAIREVLLDSNVAPGSPRPGSERPDRCVTCHLAAGRPGFDDERWRRAFRSHPRLELFAGESSPHPSSRFGCTSCHGGEGRATRFDLAGHLGADGRPAANGWRPILPLDLVEASCVGCHDDRPGISAAASAGRRLVATAGCEGCHPRSGDTVVDLPDPGPPLGGIAVKTDPAWAFRFIAAPRAFRATTAMPHLFDLETNDRHQRELRQAETLAIVSYLWEHSRRDAYPPPPDGKADTGRELFESVGCAACHLLDEEGKRADHYPGFERLQGPSLARLGEKVDAGWLYAWLRDPHAYRRDTPMPSLRLGPGEAADMTSFLMGLRAAEEAERKLPPMPVDARDELVLAGLRETLTVAASDARLEEMGERERDLFLGERSILRYGCHGCHDIPGLGDRPSPDFGTLTDLGRQLPHRVGSETAPGFHDGVHAGLPDYGWDRREADAIAVALVGWSLAAERPMPEQERRGRATRALLESYGCRSCHRIDGERSAGALAFDRSTAPPDLGFLGARVRSDWLAAYLRDPGSATVRPWLELRMPSFRFDDTALDRIIRYFADRHEVPIFEHPPPAPENRDLVVGRTVFRLMQCDRCHPGSPDGAGLPVAVPAPSYALASDRLRAGWAVEWLLDPHARDPRTAMPATFFAGDDMASPDASYMLTNISTPMFREDRARLTRAFESDEELVEYFSDPRRVASALRDYLWTLEE